MALPAILNRFPKTILMLQPKSTRAASKATSPILCWVMTSEVNVGGMAVEVEPSQRYSVMFCGHATDGSRVAV